MAGLFHNFHHFVERYLVCPVSQHGIRIGIHGTGGSVGIALDAGICTKPQTGSQVSPKWCSNPISAAYSICAGVPPNNWAAAAAAMAQATPTSPWHPTSAPDMDAFFFTMFPKRPAVAKALRIRWSLICRDTERWYNTDGSTPQEPQVGGRDDFSTSGILFADGKGVCEKQSARTHGMLVAVGTDVIRRGLPSQSQWAG